MPKLARAFWLPRRGNSPAEYEDAFAMDEATGRYAVADGATEGSFTGLWARLLVESFVKNTCDTASPWPESLTAAQEDWDTDVRARNLPWYAEQDVSRGAHATFLGLILASPAADCYEWRTFAVGDTCLLHTHGGGLVRAFPLGRAQEFDNFPKLVGSRMPLAEVHARQSLWSDGRGQPGDCLWMMTDALAHWCLAEAECGGNPWGQLESLLTPLESEQRFDLWIEGLRDSGRLRNDDVTLLAIRL
jgi:hypothetical protein